MGGVSLNGDAMYFYEVCACVRPQYSPNPNPKPTHMAIHIHPPTDASHPPARHATPCHAQVYGDSQAQKDAETRAHHRSLRRSVSAALRALSPEERQFLRMKYGLDDGKTKTTRYATHTHTHASVSLLCWWLL